MRKDPASELRRFFTLATVALVAVSFLLQPAPALASDVPGTELPAPQLDIIPELVDSDGTRFLIRSTCSANIYVKSEGQWVVEQRIDFPCVTVGPVGLGAIDGETLVLLTGDGEGGHVYRFYDRIGGTWQAGTTVDDLGVVALEGDVLAIGRPDLGVGGTVRIYRRSGESWTLDQELTSADPRARRLGDSIDLDGGILVAGDPDYEADTLGEIGSIYIFEDGVGGFTFSQRLFAPIQGDLGEKVAIDGSRIVGIDDDRRNDLVRIFEESGGTWSETETLFVEDIARSISLMGDVLVGFRAPGENTAYFSRYDGTDWSAPVQLAEEDRAAKIVAPDDIVVEPSTFIQSWQVLAPDGAGWQVDHVLEREQDLAYGRWGAAIAADGDLMATGIPGWEDAKGGVQLYRQVDGSWERAESLRAWDLEGGENSQFGAALDIDGERVLVGLPTWPGINGWGKAWLFDHVDGEWLGTELPGDFEQFVFLGEAVALSGDWAALGARGGEFVQLFEREAESWIDRGRVTASDGDPGDFFGGAAAMDGDLLAVGARRHDAQAGAVYVYERSGMVWVESAKLTASDGAAGDFFGVSLDLEGDRLVIGANQADMARGAVYIFERAEGVGWNEVQKLTASDGVDGDAFGRSVSLLGERLVVGATNVDGDRGRAYVFERSGALFEETLKLDAPAGAAGDQLGTDVAALPEGIAAGAPQRTVDVPGDGAVYVFDFTIFADGFESGDLSAWSASVP